MEQSGTFTPGYGLCPLAKQHVWNKPGSAPEEHESLTVSVIPQDPARPRDISGHSRSVFSVPAQPAPDSQTGSLGRSSSSASCSGDAVSVALYKRWMPRYQRVTGPFALKALEATNSRKLLRYFVGWCRPLSGTILQLKQRGGCRPDAQQENCKADRTRMMHQACCHLFHVQSKQSSGNTAAWKSATDSCLR